MKRARWMLTLMSAVTLFGAGCAVDDAAPEERAAEVPGESEAEVSGLSLSLSSTDSQGRTYRLRNATFTVRAAYEWFGDGGVPSGGTVLSTETDPSADRLSLRVASGYYEVALGGDWYIERLTPNGPERVEQVALLTEQTQFTYVGDGWNYDLEFRFGVDGTLIDFRHGDLNIDIGIELPGEAQSYDAGVSQDGGGITYGDGGITYGDGGSILVL
jgi:hypothetical protein